jgi:hypothetical protein
VLADVSAKLLTQIVACLEETVLGDVPVAAPEPSPAPAPDPAPVARRIDSAQAKPIDLLDAAGGSAAKRALPLLGVLVALWLLLRRRRRG